ncbi:MAG: hypothetical protein ABIL39_11595 [candidate division WOR-3 bacterium]
MNCNDKLVCLLVSKKRCTITEEGIFIKEGKSTKNAVIKIRGMVVPKGINIEDYRPLYVKKETVEHLPFFN